MDNNNPVSFIAFEATCTRLDRIIRRLTIALVLCVVLVFASNALWLYAWMQYDYADADETTTETVTVDADSGTANYANNGSVITNGEGDSDQDYEEADPYSDEEEFEKD